MTDPFFMPPVPAVYVKVIVRPVCDAETLLTELAAVPDPSADSAGMSVTRWATHWEADPTVAGIGVNALGHAHPRLTKVIREQAGRLLHTSNLYYHEYAGPLADSCENLWATVWAASWVRVTLPCAA